MRTITVHQAVDEVITTAVREVYDRVFADQPDPDKWRQMWDMHTAREGFRVAVAYQGAVCSGFVYGYTGRPGQWWVDEARRVLPTDIGDAWLGGHFEVVSLAVLPEKRGAGTGQGLMESLLRGVPHQRAVLMTEGREDNPAYRLYNRTGWQTLGVGLWPGTVVMGKTLK